jgi:hypothetical protein
MVMDGVDTSECKYFSENAEIIFLSNYYTGEQGNIKPISEPWHSGPCQSR